ncbi:DUF1613 domain-containing protein [Ascosphaera apis ARSEF 7405]|uniref:tRNA (uracil-O(2)-)-methyltransferase n=1 Tax=Ascosphaera apis ARSEF 7405 TaxID=392613 RepID=A0A167XY42_9EURO|nr:DUF1613 domain-containing protein [Ascosphaera apis ARSEF 7405]
MATSPADNHDHDHDQFLASISPSPSPPLYPPWSCSPQFLSLKDELFTPTAFYQVTDLLLANPNLNSTHVFRADILFDSAGKLKSPDEEIARCYGPHPTPEQSTTQSKSEEHQPLPPYQFANFNQTRTVLRKFIPRNPNIDPPLLQTCHFYESPPAPNNPTPRKCLFVLRPHVTLPEDMPWYHPKLQALAFFYEYYPTPKGVYKSSLSLHFLLFPSQSPATDISSRLQRTLLSLLKTQARLCLYRLPGADLDAQSEKKEFPGFVDVACGNGVLVYILHQEGYPGWGFDARRRKTRSILPESTQSRLKETIYIPQPFIDAATTPSLDPDTSTPFKLESGADFFNGIFHEETFIISNHADELTLWTPLIGAMSKPASPMPFLAIPCCSHSLSGARYRFPPPKQYKKKKQEVETATEEEQPASGDLKALAAQRKQERADPGVGYSAYASLTARLVEIANEVGYADVEKTLLRIPSTRNIGVIGGMKLPGESKLNDEADVIEKVARVVERECKREGGVGIAANLWIKRAEGLQKPGGKSKRESGHP